MISHVEISTYSICVKDLGQTSGDKFQCSRLISIEYHGIFESKGYIIKNFGELWPNILNDVLHDRFYLNQDMPIWKCNAQNDIGKDPFMCEETKSTWCMYSVFISKLHARFTSRVLFGRHALTNSRN
jgi:hypothetical protein